MMLYEYLKENGTYVNVEFRIKEEITRESILMSCQCLGLKVPWICIIYAYINLVLG